MHAVGREWIIDASGCDPASLSDQRRLVALFDAIVRDLELRPLQSVWHRFDGPGGVTGMLLLSESHLTCHTYPEFGSATFNLYCCRARPEWAWREQLALILGATDVTITSVERRAVVAPQVV